MARKSNICERLRVDRLSCYRTDVLTKEEKTEMDTLIEAAWYASKISVCVLGEYL